MLRARRDPMWLILPGVVVLVWCVFAYPQHRTYFFILLGVVGFLLVMRLFWWVLRRIMKTPVPDSAVREMLDRCIGEEQPLPGDELVLVRFRPRVSLEEARQKTGMSTYSADDRVKSFMMKCSLIGPSRPDVIVFYSSQKGCLVARRRMVVALEQKYGRWILDNWNTFTGAALKSGLNVCSLDGPQLITRGRHVGSPFAES